MKGKNMNYQEVIKELHGKLEEYIKAQGVEVTQNGFFRCIHPDHDDKNPSASLNYGNALEGKVFHCFSGRGHDGNIFTAAHWLEGLPLQGHDFWEHTMVELCKRYNIDYEPLEVDEGTRRQYQAYRATGDAGKIIHNMSFDGESLREHVGIRHLIDRGVNEASIKEWGIGVLTSFKDYKHGIQQLGHNDENFLYSKDLMNKNLFNRDSFIIPIHDHSARVVGFVTRNCRINPNDHVTRKYINTINTDIYEKGSILFGYHKIKNDSGPLWIVEGYLDAIMLKQAGLKKVVAIGATVLTNHHITETLFNDQTDIIICLDADKGGEDGVKLALERMACYRKFNVMVVDLPRDYDPDTYVREFGVDNLESLERLSPFAWSLKHSEYSDDMTTVAEKMISIIAAEESSIGRLRMIRDLSNHTAIPELDIRRDVDALVSKEDDKYLQGIRDINQFAGAQLSRRKVSDTKSILRDALNKVEVLDEKHNSVKDMQNEYMNKLTNLDQKLQDGDFKYGLLCPRHKGIETTLDGIPYWTCMTLFGGRPSAGKTAFVTDLSLDIIEANADAAVFYMSIDDNMDLLTTKMLAVRSGLSTTEIKGYKDLCGDKRDRYHEAMGFLKKNADRFIIADSIQGNSVDALENHVRWFCREFKDQKKVFVLDNFHKLRMEIRGQTRKSDAISDTSQHIKEITQLNDIHIIATVELRKLQTNTDRPTRNDMQGSAKLDYDADVIGLVHNDMQVDRATRLVHYMDVNGDSRAMPWIELSIDKNKVNGKDAQIVYKYNKHNMQFTEGSTKDFYKLKDTMKKRNINF